VKINVHVETDLPRSARVAQVEGMFDVPAAEKSKLDWQGEAPIEDKPWHVGLIVGPSGSGKTTLAREMFTITPAPEWDDNKAAIDCFAPDVPIDEITAACQSVGFNTVPAWLRPHRVLSNGERFRADMARVLLETPTGGICVVDEFTSVVDRQVGMIVANSVQKWARRNSRQFVAVTCHHDIEPWLQPDWVLEPATMTFVWRSVQPRPKLSVIVAPAPFSTWEQFAPFHYLTSHVHPRAKMFVAYVVNEDGGTYTPTAIAAVINQVGHKGIYSISRVVTLPDWQGLGLAFVVLDALGAALRTKGLYLHGHPAHPALVRSLDRSPRWALRQLGSSRQSVKHGPQQFRGLIGRQGRQEEVPGEGMRHSTTFRYCGPPATPEDADRLLVPHLLRS
jgi:GNAT superfamily N-acetyltransferase